MKIIALEGIDSAGKGTQINLLSKYLTEKGYFVIAKHFPRYDSPIGELISKCLNKEVTLTPEAFHLLYEADRYDFQYWIERFEKQGVQFLLLDRYVLSNLAFGMAKGLDIEWLQEVQKYLRQPDITFIIDVLGTVAYKRKIVGLDMHEKDIILQNRTRAAYLHLGLLPSVKDVIQVIDGNQTPEKIHEEIVLRLNMLSSLWDEKSR